MQTQLMEYYSMVEEKVRKVRKRRKPLTEEQKAERRERLAKAREAKAPPKYLTVHPSVRELPEDHYLSLSKVRGWLKKNKNERSRLQTMIRRKQDDRKIRSDFLRIDTYCHNIDAYIRSGVWLDLFYGEDQQHKVKMQCLHMAYDENGQPKRSVGTWYPDIGTYTQEMYEMDRGVDKTSKKKRKKK